MGHNIEEEQHPKISNRFQRLERPICCQTQPIVSQLRLAGLNEPELNCIVKTGPMLPHS